MNTVCRILREYDPPNPEYTHKRGAERENDVFRLPAPLPALVCCLPSESLSKTGIF